MRLVEDSTPPVVRVDRKAGVNIISFDESIFGPGETTIELANALVEIHNAVSRLISDEDRPKILISFDNVHRLTSGMLGVLVELSKLTKDKGGQFHLSGVQPMVSKIFTSMRLDEILSIHDDEDEAMRHFD